MKRSAALLGLALLVVVLSAHVGTLDTFFNGKAGPYQVQVTDAAAASRNTTRIAVLTKAGAAEDSQTTQRILALLHEQLK